MGIEALMPDLLESFLDLFQPLLFEISHGSPDCSREPVGDQPLVFEGSLLGIGDDALGFVVSTFRT